MVWCEKIEDVFVRFDRIHKGDRRTDGQTGGRTPRDGIGRAYRGIGNYYRVKTARIDGNDSGIKLVRWQHPAVGCGVRLAVHVTTYLLVYLHCICLANTRNWTGDRIAVSAPPCAY